MKVPCFLLRFQEVVPRGIPESASVTVTKIKGESRDYVTLSGTETRINSPLKKTLDRHDMLSASRWG